MFLLLLDRRSIFTELASIRSLSGGRARIVENRKRKLVCAWKQFRRTKITIITRLNGDVLCAHTMFARLWIIIIYTIQSTASKSKCELVSTHTRSRLFCLFIFVVIMRRQFFMSISRSTRINNDKIKLFNIAIAVLMHMRVKGTM